MHSRHVRGIVIVILCAVVRGYHVYKDIWTSPHGENYNTSVRLGRYMTCMLFPLCDPGRPAALALLHDLSIRISELAVDEDGIESDGVSFGLGNLLVCTRLYSGF